MGWEALTRRELVAAGAGLGAAAAIGTHPARAAGQAELRLRFAGLGDGAGWPGWTTTGAANLRRESGHGVLEAGTDVFPSDPRPVAFPLDFRFRDGEIAAGLTRLGSAPGVVVRRTGPRSYYAATYEPASGMLAIVRRQGSRLDVLVRAWALGDLLRRLAGGGVPARLSLAAAGSNPTRLTARLESPGGSPLVLTAADSTASLQAPGDAGVLATARTLLPGSGPPVLPALGNLRLLAYGVQEGQAVLGGPVGDVLFGTIRALSSAAFSEIRISTAERPRTTAPAALAATTGAPVIGGALLRVATDVPARVTIEVARDATFRRARKLKPQRTNGYGAAFVRAGRLPPGRRVHWRARLQRKGTEVVGPKRSFRMPPAAGSPERYTVAVGACASQFGRIFDVITAERPDAFVWQGDLNYPDTAGPLAQTTSGYAGIWRDFLANPKLAELLARTSFAVQRDDHDFGVQDANSRTLVPWGLKPWEALMEPRPYYRFAAGLAGFWVLDQRQFKSDPALPDGPGKTLLGGAQRDWLLRTLAASPAPFKVVCSPCTLAPLPANKRDGSWAAGFTHERDVLLDHIAANVRGTTLFVTGDTHWTMVYEGDGLFEARPCPLGIPVPNDITITDPQAAEDARRRPGVVYADDERGHFARIAVSGTGSTARLELALIREDGVTAFTRSFTQRRRV